ncbi:MAG TPA: universal stress protein [Thiohalobacter sp.]|nr:universal stress protein [Thiohalobacter sp.]
MGGHFREILVASDLSPGTDRALPRGWWIAAQHEAALAALHVVEAVAGPGMPGSAWERPAKTPQEAVHP